MIKFQGFMIGLGAIIMFSVLITGAFPDITGFCLSIAFPFVYVGCFSGE